MKKKVKPPKYMNLYPLKTARQAVSFHRAMEVIYERMQLDPADAIELTPAGCTLAAFACELFFKCVICIEKGKCLRGHELLPLYNE